MGNLTAPRISGEQVAEHFRENRCPLHSLDGWRASQRPRHPVYIAQTIQSNCQND